jgi:hypothetical protein
VSEEITMRKWEEYFMKLLEGRKEEGKAETEKKKKRTALKDTEITVEEVEGQIRKLKKRKTPGRDGVQNEAWIYETEGIVERLVEVMNGVWRGEGFSEENKAENYRGITQGIIICANFERKEEERDRRKGNGTG